VSESIGALLGAVLPAPERDAVLRRLGGDAPRASMLLGLLEFVGGTALLHDDANAFFHRLTDEVTTAFVEIANQRVPTPEEALGFTWSGAAIWLGWLLRPQTWLLISIPLVGLARVGTYLTVREPFGEPLLWAALRLKDLARELLRRGRLRLAFGAADLPDQVSRSGSTGLIVLASRPKAEWNDAVTIDVAGTHYRLLEHEEVVRPGGRRHRYHLVRIGEHDLIRRLIAYEPPQQVVAPRPDPASLDPG